MTAAIALDLTPEAEVPEHVYYIPVYRREALEHKLEIANRRLERAGVTERFHVTYEPYEVRKIKGGIELPDGTTMFGTEVTEPWLKVTLDAFELKAGEYVFVAALVGEQAGYTVHCAPGQSLDGWVRPPVDDVHCDHCGTKRDRKRLYIIREESTGKLLQVGHSCIELYTGLHIKGLWALTYGDELKEFADEDHGGGFSSREYGAPVDKVLAYSFAFSDKGRSYRSVKAAEFSDFPATSAEVKHALLDEIRPPQRSHYGRDGRGYEKALAQYQRFLDHMAEGERILKEEPDLIASIKAVAETLKPGTDYADNMHVCLAGDYVTGRNIGITASLVAVFAREHKLRVERERQAKNPPAKGFLAPVGTRVRNITLTLKTVRSWEGQYGWTTLLVGSTPDGHVAKWFASGERDYEPGDELKLEAATVKAHETWTPPHGGEPIDQTVLTRGKIDTFDERAEKLARDIRRNGGHRYEPDKIHQVKVPWAMDLPAGFYAPREWVTVGYDETKPLTARWLTSKAEVKRFDQWLAERPELLEEVTE